MVQSTSYTARQMAPQPQPAVEWLPLNRNGAIMATVARREKYLFVKRCFDIAFSLGVIICILSWMVPLLGVIIWLDSRGSVFFLQKRIGRNNQSFRCIKFRTMIKNPEADELPAHFRDGRITRVGRFLRRTNMDELPQFFNVLAGQMSIVGPRPHMPSDCIRFSFIISSYSFRHLVRPGITGWAQVNGYHGPTPDYESVMFRYYWDAMYVRRAGLRLDAKIIARTILQSCKNLLHPFSRKKAQEIIERA